MNLNQLAEKAVKHHVSSDNGAGELVDYKHKDSGTDELSVKCFPQREINEETTQQNKQNSITFHALFLQETPKKNDIIVYDGIDWKVDDIRPSLGGYDIKAYDKQHNLGVRR